MSRNLFPLKKHLIKIKDSSDKNEIKQKNLVLHWKKSGTSS